VQRTDVAAVVERCRSLAPAQQAYIERDFVTNLLATVLDFQLQSIIVVRAIEHYKANRWDELLERLRRSLAMLTPGVAASSLSREEAMALITDLVAVQARLARLRTELRRLVDEG
jgi:hypothetical protein